MPRLRTRPGPPPSVSRRWRHFVPELVQRLDLRLFRTVANTSHSRLGEAVLPRLSRAANHSVLWMGIATILGLFGGRYGKRAGMRGLLAIAVSSFLTNIPAKLAVRRLRPQVEVPIARRLARVPASTSFPSGHSASAFAFATGVVLEKPKMAPVVLPLASAVAYSRIYTGVHYPSDVAVGAAIGAGFALATRTFWPAVPPDPAVTRPVARVTPDLVRDDGEGLAVVVNTSAGGPLSGDTAELLAKRLPRAHILEIHRGAELEATLRQAAEHSEVLGIAGGDGSVSAAAAIAIESGKPLLIVPTGTLNHFASDLGIHTVDEALNGLHAGSISEVDVSTIDGQLFVNTASVGAYVDMVQTRRQFEDVIGKWPALLLALMHILRTGRPIELVLDGEPVEAWMVFFGNGKYLPEGFAPSWRPRLDDGLIDLRVVDATHPFSRLRLVWAVLTGTLTESSVYTAKVAEHPIRVRTRQDPLTVARDGETFEGARGFTVTKSDRPLLVVVPPTDS